MGRYQPRTYEQVMQYCEDTQTSKDGILRLLRYYAGRCREPDRLVRGTVFRSAV